MFKVKKCLNCNDNSFALLYDKQLSVACKTCGTVYTAQQVSRLPDDASATRSIRITVEHPEQKGLVHVLPK